MANVIKDQLQLTLTNTQIRQLSVIISHHNGRSQPGGATTVNVPSTVSTHQQDNSSESLTSALTDTSQVQRVPAESENQKKPYDFCGLGSENKSC
jgi:hypothetical protein